jgi:hypothetical protein
MPRQEYSAGLMREALDDSGDARATLVQFVQDISDDEAAALRYHRRRPERQPAAGQLRTCGGRRWVSTSTDG